MGVVMKAKPSFVEREEAQFEVKENAFTAYTGMQTEFEKLTGIKDGGSLRMSSVWYSMSLFIFLFLAFSIFSGELSVAGNVFLSLVFACCFKSAADEASLEKALNLLPKKDMSALILNKNHYGLLTVDELPVPGEK